ncbi:MAG: penicillin-binding protein activator LpoB, partial [Sphingomonadaceae bacterium]|nr:penicillin-binding protein activator LpoB [Sphingomonadaceae bacterium]
MRKLLMLAAAAALMVTTAMPAEAQSGARRAQARATQEIPRCARPLGTVAIVEPDDDWWRRYDLDSPETIINLLVSRSGCFTLVDRHRGLQSRNLERALADNGELQPGSNIGRGQVRAADYFIIPDIITSNDDQSGGGIGAALGGWLGGPVGAIVGGINVRRKEANVVLTLVDARTTEQIRLTEGYHRRSDVGFGGGAGGWWGGGLAGLGGASYVNTEIGQVIAMAYLDA